MDLNGTILALVADHGAAAVTEALAGVCDALSIMEAEESPTVAEAFTRYALALRAIPSEGV